MKTDFSFFILPDIGRDFENELVELNPFGPSSYGFHENLSMGIKPAVRNQYWVRAIFQGWIRIVQTPDAAKINLVLSVTSNDHHSNLKSILGSATFVFIYTNLDKASAEASLRPIISAFNPEWLQRQNLSLDTRIERFLRGSYWVEVNAGDKLGLVSPTTRPDPERNAWCWAGLEILYLPCAYWRGMSTSMSEVGWEWFKTLLNPEKEVSRFDPTTFFSSLLDRPERFNEIHSSLGTAAVVDLFLTKRILIEIRNEWNEIYGWNVNIAIDGRSATYQNTANNRGMIELPSTESGSILIVSPGTYFTQQPSGTKSVETFEVEDFKEAMHIRLQAIPIESWFGENAHNIARFTEENSVEYLIDGELTFRSILAALRTIDQPGHWVYFSNWAFDFRAALNRARTITLETELSRINEIGAEIKALIWENMAGTNGQSLADDVIALIASFLGDFGSVIYGSPEWDRRLNEITRVNEVEGSLLQTCRDSVDFINGLSNGKAVLDRHPDFPYPIVATHHQKFMVISGNAGLIGFCGGIDLLNGKIVPTYTHTALDGTIGYHDVHSMLKGEAVKDLLITFMQRWNNVWLQSANHPLFDIPNRDALSESTLGSSVKQITDNQFVRVTRTFYSSRINRTELYPDYSTLRTLQNAINKAKKYIYIEDQYFVQTEYGANLLQEPLKNFLVRNPKAYLIAVIANTEELRQESSEIFSFRKGFINELLTVGENRVFIYYLDQVFVHSKICIIDDLYARIGSSNINQRSMTVDSEIDIHVIDGSIADGYRRFAQNLRIDLWSEHLQIPAQYKYLLKDPVFAKILWQDAYRSRSSKLCRYEHNTYPTIPFSLTWEFFIDPNSLS